MSEFLKQLSLVGQAAGGVFELSNLLIVAGAVLLGLVVGAIPGLTGTMALALLINLTYKLPSTATRWRSPARAARRCSAACSRPAWAPCCPW